MISWLAELVCEIGTGLALAGLSRNMISPGVEIRPKVLACHFPQNQKTIEYK